jgi:hypothetical protein
MSRSDCQKNLDSQIIEKIRFKKLILFYRDCKQQNLKVFQYFFLQSLPNCRLTSDNNQSAAAHENGLLLKIIIETALSTDEKKSARVRHQKTRARVSSKSRLDSTKKRRDCQPTNLMRRPCGELLGVKVLGGVKGIEEHKERLFEAGATRIGASVGIKIVQEASDVKSNIVAGNY